MSSAAGELAKRGDQALAAYFGQRDLDFRSPGRGDEFLLKITQSPFFILPNQLADVLAGSAPVAGSDLSFHIFFQGVGQGDVREFNGMASPYDS